MLLHSHDTHLIPLEDGVHYRRVLFNCSAVNGMFNQLRDVAHGLDFFVVVKVVQDADDHLLVFHLHRALKGVLNASVHVVPGNNNKY